MADGNDLTTDLEGLHTRIRDQIAAAFPDFQTVEFYRDDETESINTPACLLELEEFEASGEDVGTGQICLSLRFSARLIFSRENGATAPMQLRLAAVALAAFVNKNRFGGGIGPAHVVIGSRDDFAPSLSGRFAIWRMEWVHGESFYGDSVWNNNGIVPTAVYLGAAPNIGPDHVGDYVEIWRAKE